MPLFHYTGKTTLGQSVDGDLSGATADAIASILNGKGITPLKIHLAENGNPSQQTDILKTLNDKFNKKKPTLDELILFSRQMYTLLRAGVPIIRAMTGLAESIRNLYFQEILMQMIHDLEEGHQLSGTMAKYSDVFSSLMISMVQIGENTGRLDEVFLQLSEYLDREKITREQVKSALRYPSFVIVAISVAMIIINMFVIPTFAKVFQGLNAELPLPTKILLGISEFSVNYWWVLLSLTIIVILSFRHYIKTESGAFNWARFITRVPIMGSIILRATLSRFARAFAMTQRSGVPLIQGLMVVSRAVDNVYIEFHIKAMRTGIERGDSLTRTAKNTEMFTPLVIQMLSVGEETGAVDEMLDQVADFYDREVDYDLKNLTSAIEPILIIAIGIMVLVLALGVFLPMWDLIGAAKGH